MNVPLFDRIDEAVATLRPRVGATPEVAIVLGSGLGEFAEHLDDPVVVPYGDIPHWPRSGVVGHAGKLVVGGRAGRRVAALSGRAHYYEGHPMDAVTFAVRVMARLGVRTLVLTNAAGGVNTAFSAGALMVIDDHINLLGANPLVGPNDERLGPRFPDMTEVYSRRLRAVADEVAAARGLALAHGVYVAVSGPSYETPAEIRFLKAIGANAVGMSTAHETIVARHAGMRVLGISGITNIAADQPASEGSGKATHQEVLEAGEIIVPRLEKVLRGTLRRLV